MAAVSTQAVPETSSQPEAGPSSASLAASYKRLHPTSYFSRYVAKGYRPDGRKLTDWRDVSINTGSISTANGSALVRIGETTMVCGVKAEIAEPNIATPEEGFVVPNIDLPAICSPRFKPGPPSDEAQTISNWINDMIVSSRTLQPAALCIAPGKAVWSIFIDIVCINYDGNAFDAAVLAVMAALQDTRLPRANFDETTGKTTCVRGETYPLPLGRIPLACTFGIFQSTHVLPDPTAFEEPLLPTAITIALDEKGNACLVRQEGLGGVSGLSGEQVITQVWGEAEKRIGVLRGILEESKRGQ